MASWVWDMDGIQKALRLAEEAHRGQVRRGSGVPYVVHPINVARIVERSGFREVAVLAALLHDVVEDTAVTLNDIGCQFSMGVSGIVAACSEIKVDPDGRPIPWEERKRSHIERLRAQASIDVRAVMLADKLDNLRSIHADLAAGRPVWDQFHAGRDRVLWYYASIIDACDNEGARIHRLADACRVELVRLLIVGPEKTATSPTERLEPRP